MGVSGRSFDVLEGFSRILEVLGWPGAEPQNDSLSKEANSEPVWPAWFLSGLRIWILEVLGWPQADPKMTFSPRKPILSQFA